MSQVLEKVPVYASLAAGWVLGKKIGCEGLVNSALVFGFLYLVATVISVSSWTLSLIHI